MITSNVITLLTRATKILIRYGTCKIIIQTPSTHFAIDRFDLIVVAIFRIGIVRLVENAYLPASFLKPTSKKNGTRDQT